MRKHPRILERVRHVLEIASGENSLKTADQIEELLIEEMRKLGSATMHEWAVQAEERAGQELQRKNPVVFKRKKTLSWWCVYGRIKVQEQIWASSTQSYIRPLPGRIRVTPRSRSRRLERVLPDFGSEHSFVRAAQSVREHYGFEISASAVRASTLAHARRAKATLDQQYAQPFRLLPPTGPEHVVAEADGTMICTVQPGPGKGKKPREWKEMRLVAAQAKESASAVYGASLGSVEEPAGAGGTAPVRLDGA